MFLKWIRYFGWVMLMLSLLVSCSSDRQPVEEQKSADVSSPSDQSVAQAVTAGELCSIAQQAAQQRAAGAVLVHVDSKQRAALADGTSPGWEFRFYSSAKDDEFVVIMNGRQVQRVRTSGGGYRKPIPEGWMDSDQAALRIKGECDGAEPGTYFFMLLATADGRSAQWGVSCGQMEERRCIMVDAFSGEVLSVKDSW